MRIVPGTFAIFWKTDSACPVQFHADIYADSPSDAARRFHDVYPNDVLCSVRDSSGRFCKFK